MNSSLTRREPGWSRGLHWLILSVVLALFARMALLADPSESSSTPTTSNSPISTQSPTVPSATVHGGAPTNAPETSYLCTVLLQTRPNRVYCYATNRPFRVILREPTSLALGEEFVARGTLLSEGEIEAIPTLTDSVIHRLGRTNIPAPVRITPGTMIADGMNFHRVALRGRVEAHQWMKFMDHHIEVIVAKGDDRNFRVNVLQFSDAATRFPPGTEVEFVGLSFVETFVAHRGPEAQMDVLNLEECRKLKSPPWITPEWARRLPAIGVVFALLGGFWLAHERRQIQRLRAAERAVRELNTDLEDRIRARTAELQGANERLRQAEKDLLRTLAAEKELSGLKTRFVSMVSHELRNPLGIVMCSTEVLKNYPDALSESEREGHLQAIHESSQRMSALMEEVLFLGRVEAGRIQCTRLPLQLESLCRRAIAETVTTHRSTNPVEIRFHGDLDGATGDESLIRHILTNLVSNALKYSSAGKPVEVELRRSGPMGILRVTDVGIGIPPADVAHVFDGFYRGSNVGSVSGFGIGLSIVRRCVEMLGGSIRFESHEGLGTWFEVELPLFAETAEAGKTPGGV